MEKGDSLYENSLKTLPVSLYKRITDMIEKQRFHSQKFLTTVVDWHLRAFILRCDFCPKKYSKFDAISVNEIKTNGKYSERFFNDRKFM